ncbi:MAG: transcription termination factor Rho [Deltaproteobacteria bacterium]
MTENEETPTQGGATTGAPPPVSPAESQSAFQPEPGNGAPVQPGAPGQGRRRRRRRGRRGRGGQPGQPAQPGQQGSPPQGGNVAPPAAPSATTALVAQPQAQPETLEEVEGVLDFEGKGQGWLRDPKRSYVAQHFDVEVPRWLIDRMHLLPGHLVKGQAAVRGVKRVMQKVELVEGTDPLAVVRRTAFTNLTATDPTEKLVIETRPDELVGRVLDLISPIGLGARALITSPPKAGKTIMLQRIAQAIHTNRPDIHLIVLLVDERPEELTDMRRNVKGEVCGSSNDRPAEEHIHAAEMAMERAKRLVEGGKDVVILLDSITRLARAYNREIESSGRTLTGGVDSRALERPKRLFGAARKAEEGGSLTIIGTALVDTGSRMDEVIFEEFKGTGNMEVVLSRPLSERRIFPAIDIGASGTRKEEKLFSGKQIEKIRKLRGALASLKPVEAMERLLKKLNEFETNEDFLNSF